MRTTPLRIAVFAALQVAYALQVEREVGRRVVRAAGEHDIGLQVFGGYGFMNEYSVARHYRDSKILEIGEGTTEVQLMLIAREAGL